MKKTAAAGNIYVNIFVLYEFTTLQCNNKKRWPRTCRNQFVTTFMALFYYIKERIWYPLDIQKWWLCFGKFYRFSKTREELAWNQLTKIYIYSYLSNKRTCPLILFKKKVQPTLWFSCNRLKIPPYPLVLRVGWIFYHTRLL